LAARERKEGAQLADLAVALESGDLREAHTRPHEIGRSGRCASPSRSSAPAWALAATLT
jgi:hypothetical protein